MRAPASRPGLFCNRRLPHEYARQQRWRGRQPPDCSGMGFGQRIFQAGVVAGHVGVEAFRVALLDL